VVYSMNASNKIVIQPEATPKDAAKPADPLPKRGSWNPNNAASAWAKKKGLKIEDLNNLRLMLIEGGIVKDIPVNQLDPVEFDNLCRAIEANYGDMLKVSA